MRKLLFLALLFSLPNLGFSKAAFWHKGQAVKQAEFIAVVNISAVEPAEVKGKHWIYSEIATAKVERVLKGELPVDLKLYGKENFICAQVRYKPGKFIVFLRKDGDLYVGSNWHLGVRPITGDKVEWFADDQSIKVAPQDLQIVEGEIRAFLAE